MAKGGLSEEHKLLYAALSQLAEPMMAKAEASPSMSQLMVLTANGTIEDLNDLINTIRPVFHQKSRVILSELRRRQSQGRAATEECLAAVRDRRDPLKTGDHKRSLYLALQEVTEALCYAGRKELVLGLIDKIEKGEIYKLSTLAKEVPQKFHRLSVGILGSYTAETSRSRPLEYSNL